MQASALVDSDKLIEVGARDGREVRERKNIPATWNVDIESAELDYNTRQDKHFPCRPFLRMRGTVNAVTCEDGKFPFDVDTFTFEGDMRQTVQMRYDFTSEQVAALAEAGAFTDKARVPDSIRTAFDFEVPGRVDVRSYMGPKDVPVANVELHGPSSVQLTLDSCGYDLAAEFEAPSELPEPTVAAPKARQRSIGREEPEHRDARELSVDVVAAEPAAEPSVAEVAEARMAERQAKVAKMAGIVPHKAEDAAAAHRRRAEELDARVEASRKADAQRGAEERAAQGLGDDLFAIVMGGDRQGRPEASTEAAPGPEQAAAVPVAQAEEAVREAERAASEPTGADESAAVAEVELEVEAAEGAAEAEERQTARDVARDVAAEAALEDADAAATARLELEAEGVPAPKRAKTVPIAPVPVAPDPEPEPEPTEEEQAEALLAAMEARRQAVAAQAAQEAEAVAVPADTADLEEPGA